MRITYCLEFQKGSFYLIYTSCVPQKSTPLGFLLQVPSSALPKGAAVTVSKKSEELQQRVLPPVCSSLPSTVKYEIKLLMYWAFICLSYALCFLCCFLLYLKQVLVVPCLVTCSSPMFFFVASQNFWHLNELAKKKSCKTCHETSSLSLTSRT